MRKCFYYIRCGHKTDKFYRVGEYLICKECMERETFVCSVCGKRFWNDQNDGDDDTPICEECYDNGHYSHCISCGRLLAEYDERYVDGEFGPYCDECYEKEQEKEIIHEYNYKPEPIFYGMGSRYMGVELEVDHEDCDAETAYDAENVLDLVNEMREKIYIKHDGSLNYGFEVVTHPMTLEYHKKNMPWEDVCSLLVQQGYRSHMTDEPEGYTREQSEYFKELLECAKIIHFPTENLLELWEEGLDEDEIESVLLEEEILRGA